MFEAELTDQALAEVQQQLSNTTLSGLTQDRILFPILPSQHEIVALSTPRSAGWRNLEFHSSESWASVKEPMERLQKLMKGLRKTSGSALSQEKANRCLPPGSPPTEIRGPAGGNPPGALQSPAMPSAGSAPPQFLARLWEFKSAGVFAERKCLLLLPDGQYRLERSTQKAGDKRQSRIVEDRLNDAELKQLQDLLQAPDLLNAGSPAFPQTFAGRELAMTTVSIPRGKTVQTLSTARIVGLQVELEIRDVTFGDARPLQPFLAWAKVLESRKVASLQDAVANDCTLPQH